MDDFYSSDFDVTYKETNLSDDRNSKLDPAIYLRVSSVLFVRAGVFLSQVSSIPSSNIQVLIFQNIIDIAFNTVVYSLIGHLFAFGKDFASVIGIEGFLTDESDRNDFAEGWLIVVAVSGLVIAAIGDRISFIASLILNALVSGIVFPIFIHWTLTHSGWMRMFTVFDVKVSYKDYSYSCLIHMSGGFLAFLSLVVLNKRLLRFKDMDVSSVPDNGPSLTLFGNFFMIIGFMGIGVPTNAYISSHKDYNFYGIVLVNTLLSAFASITTTLLLTFSWPVEPLHKWTSLRSMQAGISGIAVIASGADVYYPLAALLIGLSNGIVFFLASFIVNMSPIEDYSNLTACHFVSGFIGTLLPPVFGVREGFNETTSFSIFVHLLWQFVCDVVILAALLSIFIPVLFLLDYTSLLRSWDEDINHRRALFASRTLRTRKNFNNEKKPEDPVFQPPSEEKPPELNDSPEFEGERVSVLFEKKQSPKDAREGVVASTTNIASTFNFPGDYAVNYVINTNPMSFFEDILCEGKSTGVEEAGDAARKFVGKREKFFEGRVAKGLRNISDSKLFHKFKESWAPPRRRWKSHKARDVRLGSDSTFRMLHRIRHYTETQV